MSIRIGLLGAGRIGQVHADAIAVVPNATLVAVAEPLKENAERVSKQHEAEIRSIEEIESSSDIDAVIICTPTDTHADLIEKFVGAGKAVFCEKPIDLDSQRVQKCLEFVKQNQGILMVGFQRRFDPDFLALKERISEGAIGDVEMITLTSRDPAPPPMAYIKRSGGIFRDMTIHDLDVARWLLEEEVHSVQASASVLVNKEIGEAGDFDSVNLILTTATGKQCTINNSRRATYGYDQRIEVHGSKGVASAGNHHVSRVTVANGDGYTQPPLQDFFMTRYTAAYEAEIAEFIDALNSKRMPSVTGQDGLRALELADAALESVKTAKVVTLSHV